MFIPVCNSAPRVSRSNSGRKRAIGERRDTRQVVRPILSELYDQKQMRAISVEQTEVQIRTNIRPHQRHPLPPPPESSHAIKAVHQLQSTLSAHTRGAQILTPS